MKQLLSGISEKQKALSTPFIIMIFLLANAMIAGLAFMIWQRPQYESFLSARTIAQFLERRYAIDRLHADAYSDNLLKLEAFATREDQVLRYDQIAGALAQVRELAVELGIWEIEFFAGDPVGVDSVTQAEGLFVALRATTTHEGSFEAISSFVHSLADGPGRITGLNLEWLNAAGHVRLRMDFLFFGLEQ